MNEVLTTFAVNGSRIVELLPADAGDKTTLLYRHVNPGHSIECMWFVMTTAVETGRADAIDQALQLIESAARLGWDSEYGGLLRYVDCDGGAPKGETRGGAYEQLVLDTHDTKLWWPHSEMLYSTLLGYSLRGEEAMIAWYEKVKDYTFKTFPNPDKAVGEWIQIRNRSGEPIEKTVALPVKDPYHILRNMLLIIELLQSDPEVAHELDSH
jgi:N-acylglucosamine 2-epimerase